MLDAVKKFFGQHMAVDETTSSASGGRDADDRLQIAAAALLLELAHADDEFSDTERAHLEHTLRHHFAVTEDRARELMRLANEERQRAVDLFGFTRLIAQQYDEGQKMVLVEVMWRLAYADGELAKHESYLMRKISNLLDLRPGYLASAKRRALGTEE